MITAEQISKSTEIDINAVRYRLSVLRRKGKIKFKKYEAMYLYAESVAKKVMDFNKGSK